MTWYAQTSALRTRQLVQDVLLALWVLLWVRLAVGTHSAVERLGAPGRSLQQAGSGLASGLGGAADRAGDVPLVGGALRGRLADAAGGGRSLERAGVAQQTAVDHLALLLALIVLVLPVLAAVLRWLPPRLQWRRDARAALALRGDVELLALRAATSAPLPLLATLGPEPVARWRRGEPGAAEALASLELQSLGLR